MVSCPPWHIWQHSDIFFGGHNRGMSLACSRVRDAVKHSKVSGSPQLLPNIKNHLAYNVNSVEVEKSCIPFLAYLRVLKAPTCFMALLISVIRPGQKTQKVCQILIPQSSYLDSFLSRFLFLNNS